MSDITPEKPKTVCNECANYEPDEVTGVEYCAATAAELWDKVRGELGVHTCQSVNDGDCKFYVALTPP